VYRSSLLLIVLTLAACSIWPWPENQIAETKRRGDIICSAIDKYRVEKGKYPIGLAQLQPHFLREIPQPTVGYKQWHYELIDNRTNYWLEVIADEFGPNLERSSDGRWNYTK
jgi:hypothetical protein